MLRRVLPLILLVLMCMLDVAVLPFVAPQRFIPLFSLTVVAVLGLLLGRTRGALYGLIGGLMLDIMVLRPFGLASTVLVACGYLSGILGRRYQRNVLTPVATPFLCYCIYELAMAGYSYLAGMEMSFLMLRDALIRAALATLAAQLMYILCNHLLKPNWSRYAGR